ncbi:hypothetical protein BGV40_08710 [Methanosarcina sp. Ant1]|nr:hypothetical protein BGV40_08710 [Methanosarcina sp. Ant1]
MNEYELVKNKVISMLNGENQVTGEIIQNYVHVMTKSLKDLGRISKNIDEKMLIKDIETCYNVWIGEESVIDKWNNHIDWLPNRKSQISWRFSKRYERFLVEEKGWSQQTVDNLSNLTDKILERLEDPYREGSWDRRGMIVGQVQSGKTANYIGLVCKAVDAGYKLIVVLTGMNDSLRSQTQLRFDESFLGYDTRCLGKDNNKNFKVGVGTLIAEPLKALSLTSSANDGDFNIHIANRRIMAGVSDPVLLVIKKNSAILRNLLNWAIDTQGEFDSTVNKKIVKNAPILVIDDEADNASVNTNKIALDDNGEQLEDYDVTKINGQIRQLLNCFEKSAYVGYTATPFANIFIFPAGETLSHGEDLFPRDFIINLPAPSNYIGPLKVFGLQDEKYSYSEGLPLVRFVDDYSDFVPDKHKKKHVPRDIPQSLRKAIKSFVLSCAARLARGQDQKHNSMLIHVTRYNPVQEIIGNMVQEEVNYLRRRIEYNDGFIFKDLKDFWFSEYITTTKDVMDKVNDPRIVELEWEEVEKNIMISISKMEVRIINGSVGDVLNYSEHPSGLNIIAIGGDKLSRGLTLEGLTVSYYLRASRMYDTLMQMGRWFGYRPGYIDLCRLYTSEKLVDWYKFITLASEELKNEFDYMAKQYSTPEEFGLRVRTHPKNLIIITAVNKMRSGTEMLLSYSNSKIETVVFHKDREIVVKNFNIIQNFFSNIGSCHKDLNGNYVWRNVSYEKLIGFLGSNFTIHPDSRNVDFYRYLGKYIESQITYGYLTHWTIVLVSNTEAETEKIKLISGLHVGLSLRSPSNRPTDLKYTLIKSRLLGSSDESIDLNDEQKKEIILKYGKTGLKNGSYVRSVRNPKNGLMLIYALDPEPVMNCEVPFIGIAFSIPEIENDQKVKYVVNPVYREREFGYE